MNILEGLYYDFMLYKINAEYIDDKPNSMVFGEAFINNYYFILFGDADSNEYGLYDYYLIVENCKHPSITQLAKGSENSHKYITFRKNLLYKNIEKPAFNCLINNHLFLNIESGKSKLDNLASIHRLNCCLYTNLDGLEVHHNNKEKNTNRITNLTPLNSIIHDELDLKEEPEFSQQTSILHNKFLESLTNKKRYSVTSNVDFMLEILTHLHNAKTPKEIKAIYKNKISLSKIYSIKNYFYYLEDFLEFLYIEVVLNKTAFNKFFNYQWEIIWEFEDSKPRENHYCTGSIDLIKSFMIEHYSKWFKDNHSGYY